MHDNEAGGSYRRVGRDKRTSKHCVGGKRSTQETGLVVIAP